MRSYAAGNPAFPHELTRDQMFGELQFEAYRALGQHVIDTIDGSPNRTYSSVNQFVQAVATRLATLKSPNTTPNGEKH